MEAEADGGFLPTASQRNHMGEGRGWEQETGEGHDEPQAEFGVFSWLGTQTVHTPQSSALQKGNLAEGLKGHRKVRKVRASVLALHWHRARRC